MNPVHRAVVFRGKKKDLPFSNPFFHGRAQKMGLAGQGFSSIHFSFSLVGADNSMS